MLRIKLGFLGVGFFFIGLNLPILNVEAEIEEYPGNKSDRIIMDQILPNVGVTYDLCMKNASSSQNECFNESGALFGYCDRFWHLNSNFSHFWDCYEEIPFAEIVRCTEKYELAKEECRSILIGN